MVRHRIGEVLVDHGGVAIVDPQLAELSEADRDNLIGSGFGTPLDCESGEQDVGVFAATGLGDGRYPVYADVVEVPGAGERVARVVIDCLGGEPESDGLRERLVSVTGELREQTAGAFNVRLPYDDRGVDPDVRRRALGEVGR